MTYVNQSEAARRLGVPRKRLVWWMRTGHLPWHRPSPAAPRLIAESDLEKFADQGMARIRRGRPPDAARTGLEDVARSARSLRDPAFVPAIRSFYQDFAAHEDLRMVAKEPPLRNSEIDAYLAAVAETIALHYGWPSPEWTGSAARFSARPWFGEDLPMFRGIHLRDSPAAFKARNLFVSGDVVMSPIRKEKRAAREN